MKTTAIPYSTGFLNNGGDDLVCWMIAGGVTRSRPKSPLKSSKHRPIEAKLCSDFPRLRLVHSPSLRLSAIQEIAAEGNSSSRHSKVVVLPLLSESDNPEKGVIARVVDDEAAAAAVSNS